MFVIISKPIWTTFGFGLRRRPHIEFVQCYPQSRLQNTLKLMIKNDNESSLINSNVVYWVHASGRVKACDLSNFHVGSTHAQELWTCSHRSLTGQFKKLVFYYINLIF